MWTVPELYPPEQPEGIAALFDLATAKKNKDGRYILFRAATQMERAALMNRRDVLAKWIEGAARSTLVASCMKMLVSFKLKATEHEMQIKAGQYAVALKDLPGWSVERACNRFVTGDVKTEEIDAKKIDHSSPPSISNIYKVARALVIPVLQEQAKIIAVIRGVVVQPELSSEERQRRGAAISASNDSFQERMSSGRLDEVIDDRVVAERNRRIAASQLQVRIREYRDARLEPPEVPDHGIIASLPMMLKGGWTIMEMADGRNALVAPLKREDGITPKRRTQTQEMGS